MALDKETHVNQATNSKAYHVPMKEAAVVEGRVYCLLGFVLTCWRCRHARLSPQEAIRELDENRKGLRQIDWRLAFVLAWPSPEEDIEDALVEGLWDDCDAILHGVGLFADQGMQNGKAAECLSSCQLCSDEVFGRERSLRCGVAEAL